MTEMSKKAFDIHFTKEVDEEGSFVGLASVYGNVDRHGDIVERGAFDATIKDNPETVILWQHESWTPIGTGKLVDTATGLELHGQLVLGTQAGTEARALMMAGAVKGLSIGYDVVNAKWDDEQSVRILKEIRLWEVSLVTFPANIEAEVLTVKSEEGAVEFPARFERALTKMVADTALMTAEIKAAEPTEDGEEVLFSARNLSLAKSTRDALDLLIEAATPPVKEEKDDDSLEGKGDDDLKGKGDDDLEGGDDPKKIVDDPKKDDVPGADQDDEEEFVFNGEVLTPEAVKSLTEWGKSMEPKGSAAEPDPDLLSESELTALAATLTTE